jgi:hypothetical protein
MPKPKQPGNVSSKAVVGGLFKTIWHVACTATQRVPALSPLVAVPTLFLYGVSVFLLSYPFGLSSVEDPKFTKEVGYTFAVKRGGGFHPDPSMPGLLSAGIV